VSTHRDIQAKTVLSVLGLILIVITHLNINTVRSKIKKIEMAMINTLQLAARKNLIQMSLITIVTVIPDFQGTYQQLALIISFFHT
jgi:hypothetical protein